ncbi:MAG: acetylglutamate kinase [Candidatus Scalindua rubra]|uniref:Acetylglutamate kinase n=1 Tax=Candidatus Scalindua brodae TaxID=237368 RepID=A0A0B0ELM2_9BACT|nr:MAG: acetylglutamate kinase [Candidatus Scalindua brodae]MBZ0109177.1 acetylglutamate kinase [Candidatus Scalindua rubra]TWU28976.1 Acetylglutamate kinase [Candidatus Brocadiaceae bacterium S225]
MDLALAENNIKNSEIESFFNEYDSPSDLGFKKSKIIGTKGISMEEAIDKSRVLIEALPYIQSFKDKIVVVKFGGSAMVDKGTFQSVLQDMVFMKSIGMKPVIVHGGGPFISSEMEKRGKKPLFVNGYRVTDKETLEIAIDVLTNKIGKLIIEQVKKMGAKGVCVWGGDDSPIKARKLVSKGEDGSEAEDLGYVGELIDIECDRFINLFEDDQIPIVSPIAKGIDGENYNVNADNVASFLAGALKAEKLVFISNTHGISTDPSDPESFTSTLHEDEVNILIKSGVISGGMLPKANACISAMRDGVKKAHIIDGHIPHSLLLEIFTDKGIGTQIIV